MTLTFDLLTVHVFSMQRRSNRVGRADKVQGAPQFRGPRVPDKIHCMTVLNFILSVQ